MVHPKNVTCRPISNTFNRQNPPLKEPTGALETFTMYVISYALFAAWRYMNWQLISCQLNDILPSLTEQGIEQLYSPPATPSGSGAGSDPQSHSDRTLILKRIAKSLLLNFLELMGIMSVNPEQYAEKIQDLRTLFINFHHLLNEYRPHQARESLILMMEAQLARSKAETNGIESMKSKVEGILAGLGQVNVREETEAHKDNKKDIEDYDSAKDVWEELHREYGLVEAGISS
jgi:mediator of RNA polymerase II transcription subunit 7